MSATVEQQLAAALYADPTILSMAGANIFGGLLPRNNPLPAIMYTRISTTRTEQSGSYTLDRGYTGFGWARFQIDCVADNYNDACTLVGAVRLIIARLDLTGGGNSKANMILQERDLGDDPNEAGRFRRSLDAKIWFLEEGRDG